MMGQFDQIIREALRESQPGAQSITGYAGGTPIGEMGVRQQIQQMMLDTISRARNDPQQLAAAIQSFAQMPTWRENLMQALAIDETGLQELLGSVGQSAASFQTR